MSASTEAVFTIEKANKDHAGKIRSLVLSSGINPTALDWRRFTVALDGEGNFIACGQVKGHTDGSMELASLAVRNEWRRKGVGSALITALLEQNPETLYLMCQSSLGPLYEKFGFHVIPVEEMPKYFRRVSKLAGVLENLRAQGEGLFIMRRKGISNG